MSNERLDRLIDEVAKQLTAGQPSSDFRARVIASLDRRPGRVWRPIWIVAPLGTLAVAVLVVLVARPFSTSAPHRMQRASVDAPKREERVGGQGRDRGAESPALQRTGQTVRLRSRRSRRRRRHRPSGFRLRRQAASARQPAAARIRRGSPPPKSPRSRRRRWKCRRSASRRSGLPRWRLIQSP